MLPVVRLRNLGGNLLYIPSSYVGRQPWIAAYLGADWQVQPSLVYYDHSHDGLNHQGNKGVHSEHQSIAFHTQINCDLKAIIKCWISILTITYLYKTETEEKAMLMALLF
jgi:hypothetical protein